MLFHTRPRESNLLQMKGRRLQGLYLFNECYGSDPRGGEEYNTSDSKDDWWNIRHIGITHHEH